MTYLFVSFTALIAALRANTVGEHELATGLFYFGCGREHALNPWQHEINEVLWFFKDRESGRAVHAKLAEALLKAEQEGRVIWHEKGDRQSYEALNGLLERHRIGQISYEEDGRSINPASSYCYPGVVDRVREANLPLRVIC